MDASRWEEVEDVFASALERSGDARQRFLDERCAGDPDLRREVERLLAVHEADPDYLEEPVASVVGMTAADVAGPDARVGPYRLVRRLGRGGMGDVFLALQEGPDFQRAVALKVIRQGMDTEDVLRRFGLERKILAGLTHPNIASLLDGGVTEDGRPYFVMEYVEGEPADIYCRDHGLDVRDRIRLFLRVCDAVQHAHQNLVVHRDLKPSNILVTDAGVPMLLDFGISKLLDSDPDGEQLTRTAMRALTPEYASPEQVRGGQVSVASDVYSLGVLLYRILTDRSPYGDDAKTTTEVERAVLDTEPPRPSTVVGRRALAGDLDTIVLKALRKEPERRYGSAAALAGDLRRHLDGRPVHARGDALSYRVGKFVRRNRVPLAAGMAVFLALATATATSLRESRRVAAERDKALEVRGFLLEMFGATSPDQATGDTVTARQLLDRQVALLESSYPDPVLRAEMTAVLAEGYDRLGLFGQAEPLARTALELRRESLGERHPDVARSLGLLGWIEHQEGRSDEGEVLLRDAVAVWRHTEPDPQGLSRALNDLGVIREAAGDYDEAETLYAEALELRRHHFGAQHRAFATTASNLSVIRYRKGDLRGAVTTATEALEAMRRAVGNDHQRSIVIQSNLAAMRSALGDDAGAEIEYRDLLERQERLRGAGHPQTLRVMNSLAITLLNQGQWGEAEVLLRRALEAQRDALGPEHPEVGVTMVRLGHVLNGQERWDESRALVREAAEILSATVGTGHPAYAEAVESLAGTFEATDPTRAEALHREAVAILEERLGPESPTVARARMRLADRLKDRGRAADALAVYRDAHRVLAATLPPEHPQVRRTRVRMAEMAVAVGDGRLADSLIAAARRSFDLGAAPVELVALVDSLQRRRQDRPASSPGGR